MQAGGQGFESPSLHHLTRPVSRFGPYQRLRFQLAHLDIKKYEHYGADMRTTLTLDDDVAEAFRARSRLLDIPFKRVVNDALRRGLSPDAGDDGSPEYRVAPNHSGFVPGIDPMKLNQVNDQLEAESFGAPGAN